MATIRAAIYARVSTKPQAGEDKISIPDQLRECKAVIQREGWLSAGEYIDPGVTANTIERPGLRKLIASSDTWDVVLAWDFDRFYREKRSVAGYILDTLDENRKQITSAKQPIPIYDPATYEPRENDTPYLLREMAGFTSGMDNRRRFRTLRKGLNDKKNQGFMVNVTPYGYRIVFKVEGGKITRPPREIVPAEAAVIRRIFEEYKSGESYYHIACGLNRDHIPARRGGAWSLTTICAMIRNPVYCGKVRAGYRRHGRPASVYPEAEWKIVQGKHAPIISEELWNEVQRIRLRKQQHSRAIGAPLLLSGLVRCGYCGRSMIKEGSALGGYYICSGFRMCGTCKRNSYAQRRLEKEVLEHVFSVVGDLCRYEKVQQLQAKDSSNEFEKEIERMEKGITSIPARKSKIFELFETNDITREEFLERKDDLAVVEENLRKSLEEKKTELQKLTTLRVDRELFANTIQNFKDRFANEDRTRQKADLANVIESISVQDHSFKVKFRFSSHPE